MSLSKQDRKRRATAERTRRWRDRLRATRQAQAAQAQALCDQQVRDALAAVLASRPKHACAVPGCPERDVHSNLGSYWYCGSHGQEAMTADHFRHAAIGPNSQASDVLPPKTHGCGGGAVGRADRAED
jgi:hypothetical protein